MEVSESYRLNALWLANEINVRHYRGRWVALRNGTVVACGLRRKDVGEPLGDTSVRWIPE